MGKFKDFLEKLTWAYVAIILMAGAGFFYFMMDQSELENLQQSIQVSQDEVNKSQKKIQEAKEFERQFDEKKRKYADLVKELQKIQGALPKQILLHDLLSELLREAKKLEIDVSSITPDPAEKEEELYNKLGFEIRWSGTFLQFFIFLDRLANLNRLVSVESFDVTPSSNDKITLGGELGMFATSNLTGGRTLYHKVAGQVRVITYRYKEKAQAAPDKQGKK